MHRRDVALAVLVCLGAGLIAYGAATGDQGQIDISVSNVSAAEVPENGTITQFPSLDPAIRDAFEQSLRSGGEVSVSSPPAENQQYVRYQGATYELFTTFGTASMTTMLFSIAGGLAIILIGSLGWYVARRRAV